MKHIVYNMVTMLIFFKEKIMKNPNFLDISYMLWYVLVRLIKPDHILSGGFIRKVIFIACGLGKWFLVHISVQMRECKGNGKVFDVGSLRIQ